MSLISNDLKDKILIILDVCLKHLVVIGKVTEVQLKHMVDIQWDRVSTLNHRGHAAATTQDNQGRAVLMLDPTLPVDQLVWCILHEATHMAQVCRGDLSFPPQGDVVIWKGKYFEPLSSEDPAYFEQPWEAEAKETEPKLLVAVSKEYPQLADILEAMQGTTDIAD